MTTKDALETRLEVLTFLLDEKLETHPFPWTVEYGWGHEVVDSQGKRVYLYDHTDEGLYEARLLVAMARLREQERIRRKNFGDALEVALQSEDDEACDKVLARPWKEWLF